MFWVVSVYFNIRNTLPKSATFLLGHPVYICIYTYIYICVCVWVCVRVHKNRIEVTGRRRRIPNLLLDDLKERRCYSELKAKALDCTVCRTRFGRGCWPVARQTTEWINTSDTWRVRTEVTLSFRRKIIQLYGIMTVVYHIWTFSLVFYSNWILKHSLSETEQVSTSGRRGSCRDAVPVLWAQRFRTDFLLRSNQERVSLTFCLRTEESRITDRLWLNFLKFMTMYKAKKFNDSKCENNPFSQVFILSFFLPSFVHISFYKEHFTCSCVNAKIKPSGGNLTCLAVKPLCFFWGRPLLFYKQQFCLMPNRSFTRGIVLYIYKATQL